MRLNKRSVIAGGAAVALLVGGGMTFARWYDEASIGNEDAEVRSGILQLDVADLDCKWASDGDNVGPDDVAVPGDTMKCVGTTKIRTLLEGNNLEATLTVIPTGEAEKLIDDDFAELKATIDGSDEPIVLTENDNGRPFEVAFSVYFKEFRDSENNQTHEWDRPDDEGSDESQWWKQDKQETDYTINAGDIKLQLVQNNR